MTGGKGSRLAEMINDFSVAEWDGRIGGGPRMFLEFQNLTAISLRERAKLEMSKPNLLYISGKAQDLRLSSKGISTVKRRP